LKTQPSLERQEHEEFLEEENEDAENIQETQDMPQQSLRRSTRVKNPSTRYDDCVSYVALVSIVVEPTFYKEEIKVSESAQWKNDMKEEMDALEKNKTWDLVELPNDRKVFGCKQVYKLKNGLDDKVESYKERLVEKGYSQKEGINLHEISSPVVKLVLARVMLALVSLLDLVLEQLDIYGTTIRVCSGSQ
jgi:hypothetical protein